jgi:hypothetical protein
LFKAILLEGGYYYSHLSEEIDSKGINNLPLRSSSQIVIDPNFSPEVSFQSLTTLHVTVGLVLGGATF